MGVTVSGGGASGGTPAVVLSTTAAAGVASTFIRTDGQLIAFDATAPTTSALADAAGAGVAAVAARRDHTHGREAFATPAIVLGTAAAAGVATTPIRSDGTIVAFDVTVPVTQASADAAATGVAAVAARRDHRHGMPTISTGAVAREGGNLTEATSTSTTVVDLLTATGLTIAAAELSELHVLYRKTLGAAAAVGFGLTLNATVVAEAAATANLATQVGGTSSPDRAENGDARGTVRGVVTNHTFGGYRGNYVSWTSANAFVGTPDATGVWTRSDTGARPNATLTDYVIRFISGNSLVTGGADELNVYSYVNA